MKQGSIDPNSLYARIGGLNGLARAVDAMVNHVLSDSVILANQQLRMRAKPENVPGLKVQITNLMSSITGGPESYGGRSMKDAHRGMGVTEELDIGSYFKRLLAFDTLFGGSAHHYRRHAALGGRVVQAR